METALSDRGKGKREGLERRKGKKNPGDYWEKRPARKLLQAGPPISTSHKKEECPTGKDLGR